MIAKKLAVGVGIAIMFPIMIHYAVKAFIPEPRLVGYQIKNYALRYKDATPEAKAKLAQERDRLSKGYKRVREYFQWQLVILTLPAGILAIIIGSLLRVQAVGTGLMFGGILCLIYNGYSSYSSESWVIFLYMLFAFIALVFIGYRKLAK